MSQKETVLEALQNGERLTARQIAARYGIASPGKIISLLRDEGHAIYCNKVTNSRGEVKGKYRLGTPTRRVIAAGQKAVRAGVDSFL